MVMPKEISIEDAHQLCDHLEQDIGSRLHHTSVAIHVEPCDDRYDGCTVICEWKH